MNSNRLLTKVRFDKFAKKLLCDKNCSKYLTWRTLLGLQRSEENKIQKKERKEQSKTLYTTCM